MSEKKKKDQLESAQEETRATADAGPDDDYKDRYIRMLAELDNYRKRMEREKEAGRRYALEAVLRELLPVLDALEIAHAAEGDADSLREGVKLALNELLRLLKTSGFEPIDAVGQTFDPRVHEAVGCVPADDETAPGTVVAEERRGYRLHDRVLRPSHVQIAMQPPAQEEESS